MPQHGSQGTKNQAERRKQNKEAKAMKKRLTIIGAASVVAASATLPLAAAAETVSATADTPIAVDTREGEQRAVSPKDIEYSPDWGGVVCSDLAEVPQCFCRGFLISVAMVTERGRGA